MAILYIVATPIGNLEDVTLRALRILKEVDVIACEDTRVSKKLLSHFDIHTPLISYHAHSSATKEKAIVARLKEGENVALISDAGTPTISDPGGTLIDRARGELGDALSIISLPGPSALTAALAGSGFPASEFVFLGFLPHKKGRQTLFQEIAHSKRTTVFYESPHRLLKALASLQEVVLPPRRIALVQELSKLHEAFYVDTASAIVKRFEKGDGVVRGEFVIVIEPL